MVVNNHTTLDKNECFKMLKKSNIKEYFKRSYLIAVFLIFGTIIISVGLATNRGEYSVLGYIFFAMAVAYLVVTFINIKRLPKNIKKANRSLCEYGLTYDFKFKEESVEIVTKTLDKVDKARYQYAEVRKIYEYDDSFLIVFKNGVYVNVKKDGFDEEQMIVIFKKNVQKILGKPNKKRKIIRKNKKGIE